MLTKIDHLGIAVRSLDESVPYYEKALGLKCEHREEVPSQKVRTAFFTVGDVHLESSRSGVRIETPNRKTGAWHKPRLQLLHQEHQTAALDFAGSFRA